MKRSIISVIYRYVFVTAVFMAVPALGVAQSGRVAPTPRPTPPDEDTERVLTEEIKLNVLAFDEKGQFFNDVTVNDLVITENDILHQPESVRRLPANVLIVLDTGGEMRSIKSVDNTRRVARGLIESLRPGDSVALMQYSDKAEMVSEWTPDRERLLASLNQMKFGRRSMFVDALAAATAYIQSRPIENKHLVLITDGTDSLGRSSEKFDAFQRLLATDISVHVLSYTAIESADIEPRTRRLSTTPPPKAMPDEIAATLPNGVRDPSAVKIGPTINMDRALLKTIRARQDELEVSQQQLEKLAENTNGEFILPISVDEMIDQASLVARMIDSSYVVTYTPKVPVVDTRGIAERNIHVTSKLSGLVVQARRKLVVDRSK